MRACWPIRPSRGWPSTICSSVDFTHSPNFTAGAIYAVLAYVYDYLEGLNHVPTLVNNLARLKDVRTLP